jgi:hypothetical protein
VKLGPNTFKRFLQVVPKNSSTPLSVYSLPTRQGAAIAACVLPSSGATTFNSTCEGMLKTLQSSVAALPLGANPTYASALGGVVAKLNRTRTSAGRQLSGAKTPKAQSAAANALAGAYGQAAAATAKLQPGPIGAQGNAAIAAALRQLAGGYRALGSAATHNDKRGYATAGQAISKAQSALTAAFGQLQQAGYTIG